MFSIIFNFFKYLQTRFFYRALTRSGSFNFFLPYFITTESEGVRRNNDWYFWSMLYPQRSRRNLQHWHQANRLCPRRKLLFPWGWIQACRQLRLQPAFANQKIFSVPRASPPASSRWRTRGGSRKWKQRGTCETGRLSKTNNVFAKPFPALPSFAARAISWLQHFC